MGLRQTPLFEGIFEDDEATVIRYAVNKIYKKNAIVISQGDESDSLYVVLSGRLRGYLDDEQGKELTLSLYSQGDIFGEIASLGAGRRTVNVVALEDSRLSVISRHNLMRCLVRYPEVGIRIINHLASRVQELTQEVSSLAFENVYSRIVRLLNRRARPRGDRQITDRLTHQDIASEVGASREMVSRIMKDLKDGHYIAMDGKRIVLQQTLPSRW